MEDSEAPPNKCRKSEFCDSDKSSKEEMSDSLILRGYRVQILEVGIGKARSSLFRKKITELGGSLCSSILEHPNVLIVDESVTADRLCRLLKIEGPQQCETVTVVQSLWLSNCIKEKKLIPTETYELQFKSSLRAESSMEVNPSTSEQARLAPAAIPDAVQKSNLSFYPNNDSDSDSSYVASDEDDAQDDALITNHEAIVHHKRPLPVCFLNFYISISTAIFPGGPGLANIRTSPFWIFVGAKDDGGGVGRWTCKAACEIVTTNKPPNFLQAGCPACCPTNRVKALKWKIVYLCMK